ncbi:putative metal-dependent phosphoesterase TrpH [Lachnotalea glycerini]|uniref:Putative metal-dependent phosphoesterase TrpH n=1 Tax=Lachnotalea glycerini TaxID=1763509 RepID=A0A318EQB6_9FIRM|nr:CehA/McbA family metallohydrolase [Lachnotalea glycerini]PXV91784.1 putative metal-dependent phosphoesterase TrpH [Lachnotalea glycerini]
MSKEKKFLTIAMDMAYSRMYHENMVQQVKMDTVKLNELILWLEEYCSHKKLFYSSNKHLNQMGTVDILVVDDKERGTVSQVKLFPIEDSTEHDKSIKCKINMIREITDYNGKASIKLPTGFYFVEISKGSEYEIIQGRLEICENKTTEISFCLVPIVELKKLGWYAGDLHHHSIYSSPVYQGTDPVVETPNEVCRSMMAVGVSYGALSDHHNVLNHPEWEQTITKDFIPILSKEISTSNGHVMAMGVKEDIIYEIPKEERDDVHLRQEFIRITNQIKELGGLPQVNHPCEHSKSISWNPAYNDMLSIFQTMEIWNGSNPMVEGTTNGKAFNLWLRLLVEGKYIPATTGSDTHNIRANDYHFIFNKIMWLREKIKNSEIDIPEPLKPQIDFYMELMNHEMVLFEKWAQTNLGSAGVRTYVQVEGELNSDKILDALRKGHSFLTNGPILIPQINGRSSGNMVYISENYIDIDVMLIANKPLKWLYIYTNEIDDLKNNNRPCNEYIIGKECAGIHIQRIQLDMPETATNKFDYSQKIAQIPIKGVKWMFFIAKQDCTNMAITNPIFFNN